MAIARIRYVYELVTSQPIDDVGLLQPVNVHHVAASCNCNIADTSRDAPCDRCASNPCCMADNDMH